MLIASGGAAPFDTDGRINGGGFFILAIISSADNDSIQYGSPLTTTSCIIIPNEYTSPAGSNDDDDGGVVVDVVVAAGVAVADVYAKALVVVSWHATAQVLSTIILLLYVEVIVYLVPHRKAANPRDTACTKVVLTFRVLNALQKLAVAVREIKGPRDEEIIDELTTLALYATAASSSTWFANLSFKL
uniref:Uncharacterized protein n=1 Tax=Glossina pallidipes TaxID=7398 RepID=A0A1A9ZA88_GLOPL